MPINSENELVTRDWTKEELHLLFDMIACGSAIVTSSEVIAKLLSIADKFGSAKLPTPKHERNQS